MMPDSVHQTKYSSRLYFRSNGSFVPPSSCCLGFGFQLVFFSRFGPLGFYIRLLVEAEKAVGAYKGLGVLGFRVKGLGI